MEDDQIGMHKRVSNYTLSQRRDIGFSGGKPLYGGKIDVRANRIAPCTREEVSCRTMREGLVDRSQFLRAEEINILM